MLFAGKVVVITGASSGIGASLAKYVSSHGGNVVLAARRVDELNKVAVECGPESGYLVHKCDVTLRADHESLLAAAVTKFGKVTCWVNNAGLGTAKIFMDITDDDVDASISINTKSVIYGMQTSIRHFKQVGEGQVINVSSCLARLSNSSELAMYSAAKAAVNSLTVNARVDLQNEGCLYKTSTII